MTTQSIFESGMTFGPYSDGHCFHIEKSATYLKVRQGVQMAEFLLIRLDNGKPSAVWVVEAKSSTPRPETQPNFDDFIEEIRDKLTNAFSLGVACCLRRHEAANAELPEPFKKLNLSSTGFRLLLVVNGHQEAWLPPLHDALSKALHPIVKTWALPPTAVAVINDEIAKQYGLILKDGTGRTKKN